MQYFWLVHNHSDPRLAAPDYVALCEGVVNARQLYEEYKNAPCCGGQKCALHIESALPGLNVEALLAWMMDRAIPHQRIRLQPIQLNTFYYEGIVNEPFASVENL